MSGANAVIPRVLKVYLTLVGVSAVLVLLLQSLLFPLVLSLLLFVLLEPWVNEVMRLGAREEWAIALVLVALSGLMALVTYLGLPLVLEQLAAFKSRLPEAWHGLQMLALQLQPWLQEAVGVDVELAAPSRWLQALQASGSGRVVSIAGTLVQTLVGLLLVPVITYFLLRDYRRTRNRLLGLLPNASFELGCVIYFRVARQLQRYLRGLLLQSVMVAAAASVGYWLIGMEMAVLFGALTGVLNLIPYVGPLLSLVPPLLLVLGTAPLDPYLLVGSVVVVLSVQLLDNLVIVPALIAQTVDLHPLLVLLGVIASGALFGFWGVLLAIPFLAASKIVLLGLYRGLGQQPLGAGAGVRS